MYVFFNIKWINKKDVGIEGMTLCIYLILSLRASYLNLGNVVETNTLKSVVIYSCIILGNFFLFIILRKRRLLTELISSFFSISAIIMIVTDVTAILGVLINDNYIIGNKFNVAYLHLFVITFYLLRVGMTTQIRKLIFTLLIIETFMIMTMTGCATGIVGVLLLVLFVYLINKDIFFMLSPNVILGGFIFCALFPFFYELILNNKFVIFFVEDVLKKKMTLTGRTYIYELLPSIIGNGVRIGYGIDTNYEICMQYNFPNIQNGLIKVMMESGIVGAALILFLVYVVFRNCNMNRNIDVGIISSYICVFIVLSAIEITISISWITILLLLNVISKANYNALIE
jgi:O-antigen ligase